MRKSRFILSHYGVFKGFWDWLILVSTFYVAFVVPYNAAFVQTDRLTMASDVIVEALFIVGKLSWRRAVSNLEKGVLQGYLRSH